jgi:lipopolysaccharide/colanic/teichoic acid biosynthesis glycosyltransferase
MYKFRTMSQDASSDQECPKSGSHDRVTPLGRILRRTSLDEIPNFINVLKGEMSVVGPRPEMTLIVGRYISAERARLAVKPGITGPWQLSPYRNQPIHAHIYYDLYYIHRQSLLLDLVVMIRTPFWALHGI